MVVALLAIAVYLVMRLIRRRRILDSRPARRPVAPDDDLDFLRDLELEHERRYRDDQES